MDIDPAQTIRRGPDDGLDTYWTAFAPRSPGVAHGHELTTENVGRNGTVPGDLEDFQDGSGLTSVIVGIDVVTPTRRMVRCVFVQEFAVRGATRLTCRRYAVDSYRIRCKALGHDVAPWARRLLEELSPPA